MWRTFIPSSVRHKWVLHTRVITHGNYAQRRPPPKACKVHYVSIDGNLYTAQKQKKSLDLGLQKLKQNSRLLWSEVSSLHLKAHLTQKCCRNVEMTKPCPEDTCEDASFVVFVLFKRLWFHSSTVAPREVSFSLCLPLRKVRRQDRAEFGRLTVFYSRKPFSYISRKKVESQSASAMRNPVMMFSRLGSLVDRQLLRNCKEKLTISPFVLRYPSW